MRTTKEQRKNNACLFYECFRNSPCRKAAIVVKQLSPSKCQFWATPAVLSWGGPVVIADSSLGISGCFIEFLGNIKSCRQVDYFEDGFNEWLLKTYGFSITYWDGLVFMLEWAKTPMQTLPTLEDVNGFYRWLQGEEQPEGVTFNEKLNLSPEAAFSVIYYLQEVLDVFPDNYEQCKECKELFDSYSEGTYIGEDTEGDFTEEDYGNYCDSCRPD